MDKHILPDPIGDLALDEIGPHDVVALRQRLLAKGLAPATVKGIMERFRVVMNEARVSGLIATNPTESVPRLETESHRGRFTRGELEKLFGQRPGPWSTDMLWVAALVAAMTGMRNSEILALYWEDVGGGSITVSKAFKGRDMTIGRTKTNKTRIIPIAPVLADVLEDWRQRHNDDGLIFQSSDGKIPRMNSGWLTMNMPKILKAAGIPRDDATGRRSLHSFRHTLASILVEEGIAPVLVQQYCGWSSGEARLLTQVQAGYTHIGVESLKPIADVIERVFSFVPRPGSG